MEHKLRISDKKFKRMEQTRKWPIMHFLLTEENVYLIFEFPLRCRERSIG